MELLYSNDSYKLKLYKQNTTILSVSDADSLFILNELRSKGYDYVSVFEPFSAENVEKQLSLYGDYHKFLNDFGFAHIENKLINDLTFEDKAIVKIVSELLKGNEVIIFFDILTYLNNKTKDKVVKYLKRESKIFINVTSNEEEFIINEYVIVLNKKIVALEGKCYLVMEEEKLLKRLGFSMPFTIDISMQLKAYGLLDKTYSDYEVMVSDLWKNKN